MKSFLVLFGNKQPEVLTHGLLKSHIEHLKRLKDLGHLAICGTLKDNQGGLLIIRADSKNAAEDLMWEIPFVQEKYYQRFIIQEFIEANEENRWLEDSPETLENLNGGKGFDT